VECASLNGHVVLVVEDEPLVALDIAELVADFGGCVASARGVKEALQLIETRELSAAVLDINLPEKIVHPFASAFLSAAHRSYSIRATQTRLPSNNGRRFR
jgi:CheY-like chemotaxis protein